MGIDLLDIFCRIENEFSIRLDRKLFFQFVTTRIIGLQPPKSAWANLRVQDLAEWVSQEVAWQNPKESTNVDDRVKKIVAFPLMLDKSEVTSDAWLITDLGME